MPKYVFLLFILFLSCSRSWETVENGKPKIEKYFITNVVLNTGINYESSCVENLLRFMGYDFDELSIIGGAGGYGYYLQKGEFSILDCKSPFLKEKFFQNAGINYHIVKPSDSKSAWDGVKLLLSRGIPVVLRVDIRYLTYRYKGKPGPDFVSDGRYNIILLGIDTESNTAYVFDNSYNTIKSISLFDLDMARKASLKLYPPEYEYYYIEKKESSYNINRKKFLELSLKQAYKNMVEPEALDLDGIPVSAGLSGLQNLSNEIYLFEKRIRVYNYLMLNFYFLYYNIEENGTGGSAFRKAFRDYLSEEYKKTGDLRILKILPVLDESIKAWRDFAIECKRASEELKVMKGQDKRLEVYKRVSMLAYKVYEKEKVLAEIIKKSL